MTDRRNIPTETSAVRARFKNPGFHVYGNDNLEKNCKETMKSYILYLKKRTKLKIKIVIEI